MRVEGGTSSLRPRSLTPGPSSQSVAQVLEEIQAERSRNMTRSGCRGACTYSCDRTQAELSLGNTQGGKQVQELTAAVRQETQTLLNAMFAAAHPAVAPRSKVLRLPALPQYLGIKTPVAAHTLSQPHCREIAASDEEKYPSSSSAACSRAGSSTTHH